MLAASEPGTADAVSRQVARFFYNGENTCSPAVSPSMPEPLDQRPEHLLAPDLLNKIERFGGDWTRKKLEALSHYLRGYVKALNRQSSLNLFYIDAFAGAGICRLSATGSRSKGNSHPALFDITSGDEPDAEVIAGSALRAMSLDPQFSHYYFIEKDSGRAETLDGLCQTVLGDPRRYTLLIGDANFELRKLIDGIEWRRHPYPRAVVFLDPYAVNVEWETLRSLFATKAVDVWYLINTATIQRLLRKDPRAMTEASKATLDRIFGTRQWEAVVYQDAHEDPEEGQQMQLFANPSASPIEPEIEKSFSMPALAKFIADRAREDLGAWVYPKALPLRNSRQAVSFCQMFMMANADHRATSLASRLVRGIFKGQEGYELGD